MRFHDNPRGGGSGAPPNRLAPLERDVHELTLRELFPDLPRTMSLAGALGKPSPRALTALHRQGARYFADIAHWRIADLRRVPNIGVGTLDRMLAALSAEQAGVAASPPRAQVPSVDSPHGLMALQRTWAMSAATVSVASWAATFLDPSMTFTEALEAASAHEDIPPDVGSALTTIKQTPVASLAVDVRPVTAHEALSAWCAGLDERQMTILRLRTLATSPVSLETVGRRIGVSRQRASVIETSMAASAAELFSPDWLPLARALARVREASGNLSAVADLGPLPDLDVTEILPWVRMRDVEVVATLSGQGTVADGLIGWPDARRRFDELRAVVDSMRPRDALCLTQLERVLFALSVRGDARAWAQRCGLDVKGAVVVDPPRSTGERVYRVLARADGPLSTDELLDAVGHEVSARALRQTMYADERIARVGPRVWALASPGTWEFRGLRQAIAECLTEHGGPMEFTALLEALRARYVVTAHSVRICAGRAPFETRSGMVRLVSCLPLVATRAV